MARISMSLHHRVHARCGCAAGLAVRPFARGGARRVYERARPFAIEHIALDLALHLNDRAISGSATIDVSRIDSEAEELALDAIAFEIETVETSTGDRSPDARDTFAIAPFSYDGASLRIPIARDARAARVRVRYRATPRRGLYFLAPDEHVPARPRQVWSQGQDEDARFWFPCHDKPHVKTTFDLAIAVPPGWFALSNGELATKYTPDPAAQKDKAVDFWRYVWKMRAPLPSYLVTLVAGEFAELDGGTAAGIPVTYYVPKGREADGRRTFANTPGMIEHFGELTGIRFPWNKYAQIVVSDFVFGGMENTTATTMYEHVLLDERAAIDITSDDLIAHELAHQWFGDYVTCRDWSHGWLNEGFATFFEHVDRERRLGRDEYDFGVQADLDGYLDESRSRYKRPIVCNEYEAPIDLFDRHLYEKGGLVLHMLRTELGDSLFWRGVGRYLERHANSIVETRDLLRALEDVSGRTLEPFFDQWVFRAGHPELAVSIAHDAGVLAIEVKQTQKSDKDNPPFSFSLPIDVVAGDGTVTRHSLAIAKSTETHAVPCPKRPSFVIVDPELAVVAEVKIQAPRDMLARQLVQAKTGRARWMAAGPLGKVPDPIALSALSSSLGNEKEFWGVRAKAAEALGACRTEEAFRLLEPHAGEKHPKVRRAVAHALAQFRTPKAAEALRGLALSDPSYLVEAEAARSLGHTRQSIGFDTLVELLDRGSWADCIRAGALDGLAALRDDRGHPHVLARTRYGISSRGRRAAVMALARSTSERKYREALEELLDDTDPLLRGEVARALAEMGDAKSRGALAQRLDREDDGRVRRRIREALDELSGRDRDSERKLRDELDELRTSQAELVARIAKLEGASSPPAAPARAKATEVKRRIRPPAATKRRR